MDMYRDSPPKPQSPEYALHHKLEDIAEAYAQGQELPTGVACVPLYEGRNTLYEIRLSPDAPSYTIKVFARQALWRRLYYSYVGRSKAARSYINATRLLALGIGTPRPIGYSEERDRWGVLCGSAFSTELFEGGERGIYPHIYGWTAPDGFLAALARFVARLHHLGIEHLDLSPGNILYRYSAEVGYEFYLIDLNRMRFATRPLGMAEAARNVARLFVARSVSSQFACLYAEARGWSACEVIEVFNEACDRFWLDRLGKLSRRWCFRHLGIGVCGYYSIWLRYRLARGLGRLLPEALSQRVGLRALEEQLYHRYFAAEDIRHTLRHRAGYSYRIYDRL